MNEFVIFITIVVVASFASYAAGWWHAGYSIKRDTAKLKKAVEESNKQYKNWQQSDVGKAYERGFTEGVSMVLDTVDGLVQRSKHDATP